MIRVSRFRSMLAYTFCLASLFIAVSALMEQKSTPPPTGGTNMTEDQVNDANIQLMRQDIRSERKKVVAANMPLTETEATKFWPVYDRYIGETIKVNDARYGLIKEYANTREAMTDTQANSL